MHSQPRMGVLFGERGPQSCRAPIRRPALPEAHLPNALGGEGGEGGAWGSSERSLVCAAESGSQGAGSGSRGAGEPGSLGAREPGTREPGAGEPGSREPGSREPRRGQQAACSLPGCCGCWEHGPSRHLPAGAGASAGGSEWRGPSRGEVSPAPGSGSRDGEAFFPLNVMAVGGFRSQV